MKITVLNGSPHADGNTSRLVEAFRKGAVDKGHSVDVVAVGNMKVSGCLGCEFCHNKGAGKCIQDDDMRKVRPYVEAADLIVFASPVHYWGFSGQLQSVITRFYPFGKPSAKEYALILSSASEGVHDAIISQYRSMVDYFEAEDCGIKVYAGPNQTTKKNLDEMYDFGYCL